MGGCFVIPRILFYTPQRAKMTYSIFSAFAKFLARVMHLEVGLWTQKEPGLCEFSSLQSPLPCRMQANEALYADTDLSLLTQQEHPSMQKSLTCPAVAGSACSCMPGIARQDESGDILSKMLFLAVTILKCLKQKHSELCSRYILLLHIKSHRH